MRPSRTRAERQQPQQQYITQEELKLQLHQQAKDKRNGKIMEQLQEKEQILQHYQNYNLANDTHEDLQEFVQANKQILNRQIQDTMLNNPAIRQQKQIVESQKEQERLKRLKLREEERLRRVNGLGSAFDDKKEPLPFQLERQLKENVNQDRKQKDDLFAPQQYQQVLYGQKEDLFQQQPMVQATQQKFGAVDAKKFELSNDTSTPLRAQVKYIQATQINKPLEAFTYEDSNQRFEQDNQQQGRFAQDNNYEHQNQQQYRVQSANIHYEVDNQIKARDTQSRDNQSRDNQSRESDIIREKQRQYREELDRQVKQKRSQQDQRSNSYQEPQNEDFISKFGQANQSGMNFQKQVDSKQQQINEKQFQQKQYADDLMEQITRKEKERNKQQQQYEDTQVNQAYRQVNQVYPQGNQVQQMQNNNQSGNQQNQQMLQEVNEQQRINLQNSEQQRVQQQKLKYREELDKQIQDKKNSQNFNKNNSRGFVTQNSQHSNRTNPRDQEYMDIQQPTFSNHQDNNQYQQPQESQGQYSQQPYQTSHSPHQQHSHSPHQQQPTMEEDPSQKNFARRGVFTQIHPQDDENKQRAKLNYAEELRRQVEQQTQKKKELERQEKEREERDWKRVEQAVEEEKRQNEVKQKQKQAEIIEIQNKNAMAANKQVDNKQVDLLDMQQVQVQVQEKPSRNKLRNDLFGEQQFDNVRLPIQQTTNEPVSSFDRLMGANSNEQPEHIKMNHQNQNSQQQTPQYYQQQSLPLYQETHQNNYIPYQNNFGSLPNQINSFNPIGQQQQLPQMPGNFMNQDQNQQYQQLLQQTQQYQNALFNQHVPQQNIQLHFNYLMQLQQSKQEIEMVRQILEEKLRIQQLEVQNQLLVDQYRLKVNDIREEQVLFEKEIGKLKAFLHEKKPKEPLNPQVFASALYMSMVGGGNSMVIKPTQPAQQKQQKQTFEYDVELPSSTEQVMLTQSTIWQEVQLGKSYMPELKMVKQSQQFKQSQQVQQDQQFKQGQYVKQGQQVQQGQVRQMWKVQESQQVKLSQQVKENNLNIQVKETTFPFNTNNQLIINNLDDFQMYSSQEHDNQNYEAEDVSYEEEEEDLENMKQEESHVHVDGFDVNMLRTQDYLHMFKENIQSKKPEALTKLLQHNVVSQEFSNQSQDFVFSSNMTLPGSKSYTDAISKYENNSCAVSKYQDITDQSQLAISGTIRVSQIQQRAQEVIMDDAEFENDAHSIILPDDDIDEDQMNNFIESQQENSIIHKHFVNTVQAVPMTVAPPIQKPLTSYKHERPPMTAGSQLNRSDPDQSISSKKYRKIKTIDVFSKLPSNIEQQKNPCQSIESQSKLPNDDSRRLYVQTPEPNSVIRKMLQQQHCSPDNEQQMPQPSNIFSNCTQMNPLTSYTQFIDKDRRAEQIVNRLDNFLYNIEQSDMFVNTKQSDQRSRKAKELVQARREDSVINQLGVLRESAESVQENSQRSIQYGMFEYDEDKK